jgi:uncharacterized protein (TIGR02271 family)
VVQAPNTDNKEMLMARWEDWQGYNVVDESGSKIGTLTDIYYDDATQDAEWARVRTGLFGMRETFIPLRTVEPVGDELRVPYEKGFVKDAPNVDAEGDLSSDDEARLAQFYGVAFSGTRSAGRFEGTGGRQHQYAESDATSSAADDAMTRSEEEMRVTKARRPSELVRLKKRVVTEPKQVTVPVQREEVRLEREPITDANRDAAVRGPELRESEHEVTLNEEQIRVDKEVVPKERVRLDKDVHISEEQVTGDVRKEEIDVEREGR